MGAVTAISVIAPGYLTGKNKDGSNKSGNDSYLVGDATRFAAADSGAALINQLFVKPGNDAKKIAQDTADKQQAAINASLAQAAQQRTQTQNLSANATAAAQARVRGIANGTPGGGTILTPQSSAGSVAPTTGKTILGS